MTMQSEDNSKSAPKHDTVPPRPGGAFQPFDVRWQNIRSFKDTEWLQIRPITIILGANGSGKTSLLAPLLLLKQSLQSNDRALPLNTRGPLFNAGSFKDLVHNHDLAVTTKFALRFHHHEPTPGEELSPPPAHPPGEVEFEFSLPEGQKTLVLNSYVVRDTYGRDMLVRRRCDDGTYSLDGFELGEVDERLRKFILSSTPRKCLFTSAPINEYLTREVPEHDDNGERGDGRAESQRPEQQSAPQQLTQSSDDKEQHEGSAGQSEVPREERLEVEPLMLPKSAVVYLSTVTMIAVDIERLCSSIAFVGPLRQHPLRFYEISGEQPRNVGTRGEYAPEILFRDDSGVLLGKVNRWIRKFEFGVTLSCDRISDDVFELSLHHPNNVKLNLADTGFGLSQVLPVIVQAASSDKGSLLIAEQPEIHLNPRLQGLLADLFADVVSDGGAVLVETHSEHLLLRLRTLIAEKKVKASDVSLLFAERDGGESKIRSIPVDRLGHIRAEDWPRGFFEDSLKEALMLAELQMAAEEGDAD